MSKKIDGFIDSMKKQLHHITQEMKETNVSDKIDTICKNASMKHNVISDVHPNDFIFKFLIENTSFDDASGAIRYYFDDGSRSAEKLTSLITDFFEPEDSSIQLLEFASGYGCVTRHLSNYLPNVSIASCDIHEEAINFIESEIGIPAILSHSLPEKLETPNHYDVIFALSFFSHMPIVTWKRWLQALKSKLKNGGYLIFTTHGMESRKCFNNPKIGPEGFWFSPQSEQGDLDTSDYGQTIVSPNFVFNQICEDKDARIILFRKAYWWEHQDLYILKKI